MPANIANFLLLVDHHEDMHYLQFQQIAVVLGDVDDS
jgi:hypothetical protein